MLYPTVGFTAVAWPMPVPYSVVVTQGGCAVSVIRVRELSADRTMPAQAHHRYTSSPSQTDPPAFY